MSGLTKDEQMTMMTLFAIFRSPLMFGGNLPDNDEFTLSLITNKGVLYVNQHSSENKQLFNNDGKVAWIATDTKSGDKFLALFNIADQVVPNAEEVKMVSVVLDQLGIKGSCTVTDLWSGKKLGKFKGEFAQNIKPHASGLYRVSMKKME
jgi:hypothetical protein